MTPRLDGLSGLPGGVDRPSYDPEAHGTGIVHLGLGAFHKAHQAAYTDAALGARGGDWRIAGISLRSSDPAAQLSPQNCYYTVIERSAERSRARVIGSIAAALHLGTDRVRVEAALRAPETRIVSLTVTEKGYGIDRSTGGVDSTHPAVSRDLENPDAPVGVAGLLVQALAARYAAGVSPFTLLCCDNLPENGSMLRGLLIDFARRAAPGLADRIAAEVAFPSTMVDRITPAATDATFAAVEKMTGRRDLAAIETEAFSQWVVEDRFPAGRPAWDEAGVLFADDVRPYEEMKLRMLNGAHSMLAYAGFLCGCRHVVDVMRDKALNALVRRHLSAAAATLPPVAGVDLGEYAESLVSRFCNPHLRHETHQIAMDGTEKLPQRILAPAVASLDSGQSPDSFAFAAAAWMRYCLGRMDGDARYKLRDPREAELAAIAGRSAQAEDLVHGLMGLPGLFPDGLRNNEAWIASVSGRLRLMLEEGVRRAVDIEASKAINPDLD